MPPSASRDQVQVGPGWQAVAYEGLIAIDPYTFDLRHLLVQSGEMPPEADTCDAVTSVDYKRVRLGTGDFLLPERSRLPLLTADNSESDTMTTYAGCREYHAEATIHFEDEATTTAAGHKAEATTPITLPAGLELSLKLVAPIDTDIAAGDEVMEKVRKAVLVHGSNEVLVTAGATVRGRMIGMRHGLDPPAQFEIAMRLETWETGGVSSKICAEPYRGDSGGLPGPWIVLAPSGQQPTVTTFVITTQRKRFVLPRGYESEWITVDAPPKS